MTPVRAFQALLLLLACGAACAQLGAEFDEFRSTRGRRLSAKGAPGPPTTGGTPPAPTTPAGAACGGEGQPCCNGKVKCGLAPAAFPPFDPANPTVTSLGCDVFNVCTKEACGTDGTRCCDAGAPQVYKDALTSPDGTQNNCDTGKLAVGAAPPPGLGPIPTTCTYHIATDQTKTCIACGDAGNPCCNTSETECGKPVIGECPNIGRNGVPGPALTCTEFRQSVCK